ncbi:fumarylacetoacetate hydrolase family protein [Hydrogenophaga palleronii]|uniref:fumarylacetoacetate hydrolase family protein n=1 Tax=Hydrogenophaga palleronii TaxID=65655 RepID=UPI00286A06C5|nr:fumarylacetoacetate hydrolase family protein [Hydrogenophaga palleronii]
MGVVDNGQVCDVSEALNLLPGCGYPFPRHDVLMEHLDEVRAVISRLLPDAERLQIDAVRFDPPVANPGKIVAAPVNYTRHLQEVLSDPNLHHDNQINHIERAGLFLKANSSLIGMGDPVAYCQPARRTDHEVELVVVIGKHCKNIQAEDALSVVAGYSVGLDMTIRGPEERSMRKSPDTYTVLGPWLVTADEIADPGALELTLAVNGATRQQANTSDLILGVRELIAFATRFYTLHPGDLLFTGTPEGVGPVVPGDRIVASIQHVGELQVQVVGGAE